MTRTSTWWRRMGVRSGTIRAVAAVAILAPLATGCRNDSVPPWGYPELGATLKSFSHALDRRCDETAPAACVDELDRLGTLAERAFGEVLEHELLDDGYLRARTDLARARERRVAAVRQARSRSDPHHLPLRRAVAAERLALRRLLAELESVRTAPPPGDGAGPV
ncbi:hypothetical protein [Streptomyces sp. NPDC051183]|uniref:hypothetical protein n=1 Tax=unclassified Streptomyces TaxID=2593676 RepID=UPI00341D6ECA